MLTIQQQNEILMAMPEDTRLKYGIQPKDYSGYKKIKKNGFVYYPEQHRIVVKDSMDVFWDHDKDDLQELDIDNPKHKNLLLKNAEMYLDCSVYVIIKPAEDESKLASITRTFKDPAIIYKDGSQYEKMLFDGSYICYDKKYYDPENISNDMAFLKGIYVMVRYDEIQVFPWKYSEPDEWEVTWR